MSSSAKLGPEGRRKVLDERQGYWAERKPLEDRRRALLAGFEMHLSKPVEINELCAVVATLARRLGSSQEVH